MWTKYNDRFVINISYKTSLNFRLYWYVRVSPQMMDTFLRPRSYSVEHCETLRHSTRVTIAWYYCTHHGACIFSLSPARSLLHSAALLLMLDVGRKVTITMPLIFFETLQNETAKRKTTEKNVSTTLRVTIAWYYCTHHRVPVFFLSLPHALCFTALRYC